jgi:hypothetical protein
MKTLEEVIDTRTDGAHAGEILVSQYQAEPIEPGDARIDIEDAFDEEILAGLVDV